MWSCDYKKGNICQNVVVCHVGGKNIFYDLEPNDVSNPLHLRGKPVMVYGTTSKDTNADGTRHSFVATKVTLIGLSPWPRSNAAKALRQWPVASG